MNLSGSAFDEEAVRLLAVVLQGDHFLEEVDLDDCKVGDDGGAKILGALERNTSLRRLNLSGNEIGPASGKAAGAMLTI